MVKMSGKPLPRGHIECAAVMAAMFAAAIAAPMSVAADSGSPPTEDLAQLSLQQLVNIQVTSVSKAPQPLQSAAAAIFVITHDEIARSGASNIAEALRLAPNLQVLQLSASNYVVSARGLGGNPDDQNFSNKLLLLIDGRSVYTPLYSGIYMNAEDVLLEDVDRIEVISGPGATLWGANAMNGVINIVTRAADQTQGMVLRAAGGNQQQTVDARYGGQLEGGASYRVYGLAFERDAMQLANGTNAHDGWSKVQGGFRADWSGSNDSMTLQGDTYRGSENEANTPDGMLSGADLLTRWQHRFGLQSNLQVQAYFDQTEQFAPAGGTAFVLDTYDIEAQDSFALGSMQQWVWGAGERVYDYNLTNAASLLWDPAHRSLTLGDVFAQDTLALTRSLNLIAGFKMEDDPYSGWSPLPDLRLAWNLTDSAMLWAAGSRAIRSPTPFDADVEEKFGALIYLTGNPRYLPETLTAYQLGYRGQPGEWLSISINAYYNLYDDLRTVEFSPGPGILEWGNMMRGHTDGIDAWAEVQLASWWRLSPGIRTVHENLEFKPGSSTLLGVAQAGNDPSYQAMLTSSMDLPSHLTFDASLRYISDFPQPALPGYYDLMARIGWRVSNALELSLDGYNLLHARQFQYPAPNGEYILRSVMAEVRCKF
jgi:iron complex outermembrane recepter protein